MGSFANPNHIKNGLVWTAFGKIKFLFSNPTDVMVDTFQFSKAASSNFPAFRKTQSSDVRFKPINFTKSNLVIGKMGAGKSQFYYNLLNQPWYSRAIIHDVKGDFTSIFFKKRRDIILNFYDDRSKIWDIFSENIGLVDIFFEDYLAAKSGEEKNYFTSSAKQKYIEAYVKVYHDQSLPNVKAKWGKFLEYIYQYINDAKGGKQESEQDIASTVELALEPFEIMAHQIIADDRETFTLSEFFEKQKQAKLFLLNNASYSETLNPYFTGFIAAFSSFHTSMQETKENLTLYTLDEYLTFVKTMSAGTKSRLHTLIRSKGGCLFPAIQYLPNDAELKKLLTSNNYAIFCFASLESDTNQSIMSLIGEVEFEKKNINKNLNSNSNSENFSISKSIEKASIIDTQKLANLAQNYQHITLIPEDGILYLGYTPQVSGLKEKHPMFSEYDLSEFYMEKHKIGEDHE
jgi:hypothetical protein